MRLRLAFLVLTSILLCHACSATPLDNDGDFEKVTSVWIEPSNPSAGDIVQVRVKWDSNLVYPAMVGAGPKVRFRVDAGALLMQHEPELGNTRISDREVLMGLNTVQWQLPTERTKATVWATMMSGGKSLTVEFDQSH